MQRLLYISESRIADADKQSAVSQIVEHAEINNAQLGLTGALIFTGQYFAQVLEGPTEAVEKLMEDISGDPRHGALVVVVKSPITDRLFPEWRMAYQGPSQFVARKLERLMHATSNSEKERAADWITDLALEFSRTRDLSS